MEIFSFTSRRPLNIMDRWNYRPKGEEGICTVIIPFQKFTVTRRDRLMRHTASCVLREKGRTPSGSLRQRRLLRRDGACRVGRALQRGGAFPVASCQRRGRLALRAGVSACVKKGAALRRECEPNLWHLLFQKSFTMSHERVFSNANQNKKVAQGDGTMQKGH